MHVLAWYLYACAWQMGTLYSCLGSRSSMYMSYRVACVYDMGVCVVYGRYMHVHLSDWRWVYAWQEHVEIIIPNNLEGNKITAGFIQSV